jgi:hypothetical protein
LLSLGGERSREKAHHGTLQESTPVHLLDHLFVVAMARGGGHVVESRLD